MSEGAPDFHHKNNVYIKQSDVNIPVSIEESKVTIDANITNSQLDVNIIGQNNPIDVNVQGGEINANITNAQIDVNVADSQVILDVGSSYYTSGWKTLANDGDSPQFWQDIAVPVGKMFVHGTIGIILEAKVYLKNSDTESHTVTLRIRETPDGVAIIEKSLTIDANSEGWLTFDIGQFWFADTMCVDVQADSSEVKIAIDSGEPHDLYYIDPSGFIGFLSKRSYIRVTLLGSAFDSVSINGEVISGIYGLDYTNKKWVPVQVTEDGKLLAVLG